MADSAPKPKNGEIVLDSEARLDWQRVAPGIDPEAVDPDHHLWRNGRLWWIAFTVHRGHLQERVRFSLQTDDLEEARHRRDLALALFERAQDCKISLRFARPRAAARGTRAPSRRPRRPARREGVAS